MIDQIFINVGHLYKFLPQNINTHVYEHWQAVDMAGEHSNFCQERIQNIMKLSRRVSAKKLICRHLSRTKYSYNRRRQTELGPSGRVPDCYHVLMMSINFLQTFLVIVGGYTLNHALLPLNEEVWAYPPNAYMLSSYQI